MPKGVLLVGSPVPVKLAGACCFGEAKVPFFNISGSEFIELFVGVGAAAFATIRPGAQQSSLYHLHRWTGCHRSLSRWTYGDGRHDEREQTLNSCWPKWTFWYLGRRGGHGGDQSSRSADKALLRSGRFDRQIVVDKPDCRSYRNTQVAHQGHDLVWKYRYSGRCQTHAGASRRWSGQHSQWSGDYAVRVGHNQVEMEDFEAAIDRILAGPEKKNRVLNPQEKRRVAYHEADTPWLPNMCQQVNRCIKFPLFPGACQRWVSPCNTVEEKFLSTENELKDQIAILLADAWLKKSPWQHLNRRQNDLEKASEIARNMVCTLAWVKNWTLDLRQTPAASVSGNRSVRICNYSDETARIIDTEIMALVQEGETRAREIITATEGIGKTGQLVTGKRGH